jgi:hypothetical protein
MGLACDPGAQGPPEAIRQKLAASLRKPLTDARVIERCAAPGVTAASAEMATPAAPEQRCQSEIGRLNKLLAGASTQ